MKKLVALILSLALVCLSLSSCRQNEEPQTPTGNGPSKFFTGEYLPATASLIDGAGAETDAAAAVNNAGMSGMDAPNHLHDNDLAHMVVSDPGAQTPYFLFKLEQVQPIGELYLWNLCAEGYENAGLRAVQIFYSTDGESYTELQGEGYPYILAKGDTSGQASASNLEVGEPIDFGGVAARYIKIVPQGGAGEGNFGTLDNGETRYGLAEARFFRFKTHPDTAGTVLPSAVLYQQTAVSLNPYAVANNSGMSGAWSAQDTHSNRKADMYLSTKASGDIVFDLDGTYPLGEMAVWNYNDPAALDCGVRNVEISYSVDGSAWTQLKNGDSTIFEFAQADGSEALAATNLVGGGTVNFGGAQARYVKLTVPAADGTWGGGKFGVSEVRFFCGSGWAVEPSRDWTGLFSNQSGWLAADGIYTVHLNGADTVGAATAESKTIFNFSDTATGTVDFSTLQIQRDGFVNHSMAFLTGNIPDPKNIQFITQKDSGGNILTDSIWLQDAVKVDDRYYVSGFKFNSNWSADRMDLTSFPIDEATGFPDLNAPRRLQGVPMMVREGSQEVIMGMAVLDNTEASGVPNPDGYIYIYGYLGRPGSKRLVVARTTADNIARAGRWEYYTGSEWKTGIENANSLDATISRAEVSSEVSITPIQTGQFAGKYMLVYTDYCQSEYLHFALSDTPYGPFEDITRMYHCPEVDQLSAKGNEGVYTYNAKAHPHLSRPGELLISYNCNSTKDYDARVYDYHPRFVTMFEIA